MSKIKIKDLPPEEREKLLAEMSAIAHNSTLSVKDKAKQLDAYSRKYSTSHQPEFYFGILYEHGKDWQKAIDHYNKAEKLLTDDLLAAQIARHLTPRDDALNNVVNQLKAQRAVMYNHIGVYYKKLGNQEQAFSYYNQALADNPNDAIALYNRAGIHNAKGNYKAVLSDAYQAIYHQPGLAYAWYRCSAAHANLGEYSQATVAVNKFKELASTNKESLEVAAKTEKFIAAAQARSKEQERPAQQQPPSSSSSSSSSSQQQAAPKSSSLARSDGDAIMTAFKEGEVSKQPFGTLTKAIQVKQEKQESEQAPSSSSPTSPIQQLIDKRNPEKELPAPSPSATTKPFAARVSNKRNRDEQSSANATEQEQPKDPGKKSKSQAEKVVSDRITRSNGKGKGHS
jgi:tetratricopeptide (TPR) repeat protein